jgi:hypothetical protein
VDERSPVSASICTVIPVDDLLAWLLRALPVLTAAAGFGARSLVLRGQMRKDRAEIEKGTAEVQQAKDAHQLEVQKFQAGTTADQEAKDREWINKALELGAEGRSAEDRQLAIDYLMALVGLGSTNPRVVGPLEVMLQRQVGKPLAQVQAELQAGGPPPEVVEDVVVSDVVARRGRLRWRRRSGGRSE